MRKQTISLLLVLLLAGAAVSCGDEAAGGTTTTAGTQSAVSGETTEARDSDAPEIVDMNDAVLTILNHNQDSFYWSNTLITIEESDGDVLNDALLKRQQAVEEAYNCTITEILVDHGETIDRLQREVTAGDITFDMAMIFDADVGTLFSGGYLIDWNDAVSLDFTKPWWDNVATEAYNFHGVQAALSGAYSLYNYSTRHCYVFNNRLLQNLAPDDNLYDLVVDGTWTVDKLYEIAALAVYDLNGDQKMEEDADQFGIVGTVTRHYSALVAGAGIHYIDRDSNGDVRFAVPENEYAQTTIADLVSRNIGNDIYLNEDDTTPTFYADRAMFAAAYVGEVAKMRGIEFDIGILPPPKYSETQAQYYSLVEGGAQSVLPQGLSEEAMNKTSVILNAFAYESYQTSVPAYIDQVLMGKVARNEDSARMLQLIFDNPLYDLGTGMFGETKGQFTDRMYKKESADIASSLEKMEKAVQKQIDSFYTALDEAEMN